MNRKYIKGLVLLGVILSIGLPSCRVATNKYKAPEVDTQDLYRSYNNTDTTSIANIPWREYFKDPALQALIDEALHNNFDLQIAVTRIRQAEAGLSIAHGALFPNVALVGQYQQDKSLVNSYHKEQFFLGAAVSWEADIWNKLNSQKKAQYAKLMGTQAYRDLIQTSLIANVATSYYSLLALDEQLKVTQETVQLLEETSATMEAMMQAGLLTAAAVEQNKALTYATKVSIPDLEINIRKLENSMSFLLGRKPGEITRSTLGFQKVPDELKYGIPVQMLAKRPDVLQAELGFRSAFELTNVARANFYPSLKLNTGTIVGFGATTLTNFFKPDNLLASVIVGLTQPIFAQNQIRGQLKIANAQQEEALLTFQETVLTASREVSDILYTFETSLTKNDVRKKQIESLINSVDYTKLLLQAGEANYIEVLTAEQNLLQAQIGQVSDKLEQLQASVNLYRALGGGIE